MSVEEQNGEVPPNREEADSDRSLDALAKGLANGSLSRRKALKLMGSALIGGLLASVPGVALADHRPGHGGGTPAFCPLFEFRCGKKCCPREASCVRGECVCPTGKALCPTNNQCLSSNCEAPKVYNATTCQCECPTSITCTSPQVLNPNTCTCACPPSECPSGQGLNPTTCECQPIAEVCTPRQPGQQCHFAISVCGTNPNGSDCYCFVEPGTSTPRCVGDVLCQGLTPGSNVLSCQSSADCPSGWHCAAQPDYGNDICAPLCSASHNGPGTCLPPCGSGRL